MITLAWKKCPKCRKRFEFEQYNGMRGWGSHFGAEIGMCPHCHSFHRTGKFASWELAPPSIKVLVIGQIVLEAIVGSIVTAVLLLMICVGASNFLGLPLTIVFVVVPVAWSYLTYNFYQNTKFDFASIREKKFQTRDAIPRGSAPSVITPRKGKIVRRQKREIGENTEGDSDRAQEPSIGNATKEVEERTRIIEAKVSLAEGEEQDTSDFVHSTRVDAEQGDSNAQFVLGCLYSRGKKVPKDDEEAVKWLRKAAEQGHASAQSNLGTKINHGRGVPCNPIEAMKWYRKSAEQNHAPGQFNLAGIYYLGTGVSKDDAEAVKWYRRAAEQGLGKAQSGLASMYFEGKGVPQDYTLAYTWSNIAASQVGNSASRLRDSLLDIMSREQIAEGQSMSRKWLEDFEKKSTSKND